MNPDTAELTIADPAEELAVPFHARAGVAGLRTLDASRAAAVRDSWRALWSSRLLVWTAGVATILALGFGPRRGAFDPPGVTRGFGALGNLLAAPAARWDSAWYLVIARYGYRPDLGALTAPRTAFFPLYPIGLRSIAWFGVPPILAGVALSMAALAAALYGIHRLTTLELGRLADAATGRPLSGEAARLAVMVTAFAPMAFYLSAVYSESLYLALSVALFWSARQGRWALVGVLGALAGATRSTGLVLALPALMIYLYGPREDRPPDREGGRLLLPRYRLRRDVAWLALLPAGVLMFAVLLAAAGGDALAPLSAQVAWGTAFRRSLRRRLGWREGRLPGRSCSSSRASAGTCTSRRAKGVPSFPPATT